MSRVAYAILCHESVGFVRDQFNLLYGPEVWFFYHVDLKAPAALQYYIHGLCLAYPNVIAIPSIYCSWGGFSLTEAMVRLIEAALLRAPWDHLVFLSEQHIPLQSPGAIRSMLTLDTNYVDCRAFGALPPDGQAAVRSRFNRRYVEVPGVGGFGTKQYQDVSFFDRLYHGSQWITLCRATCESVPTVDSPHFEAFRFSVLSDEMALQTWVTNSAVANIAVRNETRNLTFVAFPWLGGGPGMTFNNDLLLRAREMGYLYIRKRPEVLSPEVIGHLAEMVDPVLWPLESNKCAEGSSTEMLDLTPELIILLLNGRFSGEIQIERMPADVIGPAFFCAVRHASLRYPWAVYILSQDLRTYKGVSVVHQAFDGFDDITVGPYEASIIHVRAHGLSLHREVHLGSDRQAGFKTIRQMSDLEDLITIVRIFVERTLALSDYVDDRC
jgi:hypothetical protein